jgi:hypothetical protein
MKIKRDFVTNSSSVNYLVDKKKMSKKDYAKLLKILKDWAFEKVDTKGQLRDPYDYYAGPTYVDLGDTLIFRGRDDGGISDELWNMVEKYKFVEMGDEDVCTAALNNRLIERTTDRIVKELNLNELQKNRVATILSDAGLGDL